MRLTKIWSAAISRLSPPEPEAPPVEPVDRGKMVILGDEPRITADYRLRAPLVGREGAALPDAIAIMASPEGRFSPDSPIEDVYQAGARGEFPFMEMVPQAGRFEIQTPELAEGTHDGWLIAVER